MANIMSNPRIAVLGLGSIGKRHLSNLQFMDIQCRGWDTAVKSKLDREDTINGADAVIIATPTRQHMNDMIDCQGKHILVEKPMAFDAPEPMLRGFYEGKRSHGLHVLVGNNLRFHRCVTEVKKLVDGNMIGKIGWAEFWVKQKTEKEPYLKDGVSRNWGAHEIDLAMYLLGPGHASEVTECIEMNGNDVDISFSMMHETGTYSEFKMDYLTEPEQRGFKLVGANGVIEADLVAGTVQLANNNITSFNEMKNSFDQNYRDELAEFIRIIKGESDLRETCMATGMDGARVMDVILSVRSMAGLVDKEEKK